MDWWIILCWSTCWNICLWMVVGDNWKILDLYFIGFSTNCKTFRLFSKVCLNFLSFILQGWWLSIIVGTTIEHLFIGRILAGLSAGGVFVLIPLYVAEISEDKIRGSLGSFFIFSINFGTLLTFIAGNYLDYKTVAYTMIALPILFLVVFMFLPETPQFLIKCGREKDAEKSLRFLRGCKSSSEAPENVKNELQELFKKISENSNQNESSVLDKLSKY